VTELRICGRSLGAAALLLAAIACTRRPSPTATERAQIAEWQSMVASARVASALGELRTRAQSGMVEAQSALGQALCGQNDAALSNEGVAWLRKAAQASDAAALFTLGKLELSGSAPVARDYGAAARDLGAAAARGDARADYYLGLIAKNGYGCSADATRAARELSVAADHGIPQAQFLLANAYRDGDGVPRDPARALTLYEKAAEQDHPEAIQTLAMAYQNGELGLPRDDSRCQTQLAELAHAQKHPPPLP
jgi:TPR repeat protein